jgi:hypothetical protein
LVPLQQVALAQRVHDGLMNMRRKIVGSGSAPAAPSAVVAEVGAVATALRRWQWSGRVALGGEEQGAALAALADRLEAAARAAAGLERPKVKLRHRVHAQT